MTLSIGAFLMLWGMILALWDYRNNAALWLLGIGLFLMLLGSAAARDLGQWENTDPEIRAWFQSLKMPDNPAMSCCGESDAYWCEGLHTKRDSDGVAHNFCTITDDREDWPLHRSHIPIGTELEIPDHKMNKDPNPTEHSIIFVSPGSRVVYCFISSGGV